MAATGAATQRGRFPQLTKYDVVEELGHGGMATVYRAHDARLARDVAIKVIHPHLRDSPEVAHRFFVEAKAVAKLRHPNIVEVFDVSSPDEREQYLVVELLRGRTLRKILQMEGALPPEVAAAIGVELCAALAHAHGAGVVHRDVKPENVIIEHFARGEGADDKADAGTRVKVKLTDFGIAKLLDAQGVTSTGQVLGSPAHMAPEQIEGGDVDGRADVFGMGVLLYECMVGHLPFEGTNPAQVLRRVLDGVYPDAERERAQVGKAWSTILDGALAHDPAARYADASALRDALAAELKRVGVDGARAEVERFADDPAGYLREHDEAMKTRLCALGAAARGRGDVLAAAADYNRALAYAPHDRDLLRIVGTMHRGEARRRALRRIAPALVGAVLLGTAAFFATRALRSRPATTVVTAASASAATASIGGPAQAAEEPSASARPARAPAPAPAPAPQPRAAAASPAPSAKPVQRVITIGSVRPPFGVSVAVDDGTPASAAAGTELTVDGEPHTLRFTCAADACEPTERAVPAGDKPSAVDVVLKIKPALLVIDGDPRASYTIREDPTVALRAGVAAAVPMSAGRSTVHVVEHPSNRVESTTLSAGREAHVAFEEPSPSP